MRKKLLVVVLLAVVIASLASYGTGVSTTRAQTALAAPNLAPNPSFEEGETSPVGWEPDPGAGVKVWDATEAHSGQRSLMITVNSSDPYGWGSWAIWRSDFVPVQPNHTYRLQDWIKTQNVAWGAHIDVHYYNDQYWDIGDSDSDPLITGTQDWTFCDSYFTTPSGTAYVKILAGIWHRSPVYSTAWFDDVSLTCVDCTTVELTISSTAGGNVTTPGEGAFTYYEGTVVDLVAIPDVGYYFVNWDGDVGTIADINAATTNVTMQGDYEITARFLAGVVDAKTETVTDGTVNATDEADTEVEVTGTATVTVALYDDNPGGDAPSDFNALGKYIDVYVPDTTEVTELEIRLYYTDDELAAANLSEELLQLLWWDGDDWNECSDSGVNTNSTYGYSGYMWAKIRTDTTPSLDDMQGTAFGGYKGPSSPPQQGCFIATAAYGAETAKEIDILREFRDEVLLPNSLGAEFVSLYYKTSPPIANFISQHEVLRTAVRVGFVDPIVAILNWSHDLWSARGP